MNQTYKDAIGMKRSYEDIIDRPHHVSKKYGHMSMHDRAAQFAPFSALVGYEDAIERTELENFEKMDKR